MCRTCGSIIGAGQDNCAVCGASVANTAPSQASRALPDRETLRFARAVLERPYKFTIIFLVANIFVFILMWQSTSAPFSLLTPITNQVLMQFGAKMNYFINELHQWWRFITPMFLHVNLLHLMVNMYSLWIVGPYVEKLYGSAKFVVFWVVTGIAGLVASYLTVRPGVSAGTIAGFIFKTTDDPSAGASGALFGLVGVLFVFGIKFRHELPEGFRRAFGTGLLPMIFLNLFIGYMGRGFIDNAAHLGGMLAGALLALAVDYRRPGEKSGMAIAWRVAQALALVLVIVAFWVTARHFRDPLPSALVSPAQADEIVDPNAQKFVTWAKGMNEAQEAFYQTVKDRDPTNVDAAIKALESAPGLDPTADVLRDRLKTFLARAKALATAARDAEGAPSKTSQPELHRLTTDYVAWSKEYNQWLKTNGQSYGLVEVAEPQTQK